MSSGPTPTDRRPGKETSHELGFPLVLAALEANTGGAKSARTSGARTRRQRQFIDTAYLAGEWANAFGDIARPVGSTRFARHSTAEARNQNRARRGALSQAALAHAALTSGHVDLDTAVHHAHRALDLAVTVTSSRCTQAITDLHARIRPFHTVTVARDFDERARLTLAASHQT